MTCWRFIETGPCDGPTNMAVDEALLACFNPLTDRPVLRIYGWTPPALSHGRFQRAAEVLDLSRCAARNVPVVRRISGGGVIFHADEITYSLVCAPRHIPPAPSISESFRVLTAFLLRFYGKLGLDARYAVDCAPRGTVLGERTPFCFAGKERYDILIGGRKIGGNAQRRLKNVIFQHGSVPLVNRAVEGAGFLATPPAMDGTTTAALGDFGVKLAPEELNGLLLDSFAGSLGIAWDASSLAPEENAAVERFLADGKERAIP